MIKVFPNIEKLNNFAAEKFVEIAKNAIEKRGQCAIVLAGGSTPKSLYRLLSSEKFKTKIDWKSVYFFFGDERNVLVDDAESNFKMTNEHLFRTLEIDDSNIFRWKTELKNVQIIAEDYENVIRDFFKLPNKTSTVESFSDAKFDLVLLGMGNDGHTASLFPFTAALHETEKIAVENYVEKLDSMRFTLTFPIINNARNIFFSVKGADKAETLRDVLQGDFQPDKLPSQNVKPIDGSLFWLCDKESATFLKLDNR